MKRSRLTLWNAAVFAVALTLIGTVVFLTTRSNLYRAIDDDLSRRSLFLQNTWSEGLSRFEHEPRREPPPDIPTASLDPIQRERFEFTALINRPRIFDKGGKPIGPSNDRPFDSYAVDSGFKGQKLMINRTMSGRRIRVLTIPLRRSGRITGVAQFAANLDEVDAVVHRLGSILIAILPLSLLVTYTLSAWLTRRALRPVREIAEAAEQFEESNLSGRLPVRGNDEFAFVSTRFNSMLERMEQSFHRLAESNEAQRRLIADTSHELKTPLTTIKGRVGMALKAPQTPERYVFHLESIGRAADRMSIIIKDLLFLARSDEDRLQPQMTLCVLSGVVAEATTGFEDRVVVDVPADLEVIVDDELIARALMNLLSNAIRHTPHDKPVKLSACKQGENVKIDVIDEGEGISPEHLPRIFDRFYRVDPSRNRSSGGTGLGLSIVRSIIEAHGGTVTIESELGKGTTATILLPSGASVTAQRS